MQAPPTPSSPPHPAPLVCLTGQEINDLLTSEEAAALLGCSARHVARLCRKGDLPARKIGADWRIHPGDRLPSGA